MGGIIDCEMHIGDEVYVHGYIDEIRKDCIIIKNDGGYFGTVKGEIVIADTPQTDCDTCKHYKLACELFSEVCKYEPTTQTETQNSNLTFEKRTMRDCYNCKRYETEGECIECHYEPKDEPQTEQWHYDEQDNTWYPYQHKSCATCKHALGNWDGESNNCGRCCGADRRFYESIEDEPQTVETMSCAECKHRPIGAEICEEPCHYEPKDESQTERSGDEQN